MMVVTAKHVKAHVNCLGLQAALMSVVSHAIQHRVHPVALRCAHVAIVV